MVVSKNSTRSTVFLQRTNISWYLYQKSSSRWGDCSFYIFFVPERGIILDGAHSHFANKIKLSIIGYMQFLVGVMIYENATCGNRKGFK